MGEGESWEQSTRSPGDRKSTITTTHRKEKLLTLCLGCRGFSGGPVCPNGSRSEPLSIHGSNCILRFLLREREREREKVRKMVINVKWNGWTMTTMNESEMKSLYSVTKADDPTLDTVQPAALHSSRALSYCCTLLTVKVDDGNTVLSRPLM